MKEVFWLIDCLARKVGEEKNCGEFELAWNLRIVGAMICEEFEVEVKLMFEVFLGGFFY